MAPEVAQGLPHSDVSDIFAIGIIACELRDYPTPYTNTMSLRKYKKEIETEGQVVYPSCLKE